MRHTVTSTSTTTVVSSATMKSTVISTLTVGAPINASDIESGYATIQGQPEYFVVNPNDNVVYVASPFSDNLTTFELLPFSGPYITALPYYSDGIAIDSSTNIVYVGVANETAAGLAEINTSVANSGGAGNGELGKTGNLTNEVVRVLPVQLDGPLAMDSSTHVIYGIALGPKLEGVNVLTGAVVMSVSLGYPINSIAVDQETGMVFAVGCTSSPCDSIASVVNGTSGRVVATLRLHSSSAPTVAVNPTTGLAYVSGDQLVALNVTNGNVVFKVDPLICSVFSNMVVIPSLNEVAAVSLAWPSVLVYDGSTGALVNVYSLPAEGQFVAFDPSTNRLIVTLYGASLQTPSAGGPVRDIRRGSHRLPRSDQPGERRRRPRQWGRGNLLTCPGQEPLSPWRRKKRDQAETTSKWPKATCPHSSPATTVYMPGSNGVMVSPPLGRA